MISIVTLIITLVTKTHDPLRRFMRLSRLGFQAAGFSVSLGFRPSDSQRKCSKLGSYKGILKGSYKGSIIGFEIRGLNFF